MHANLLGWCLALGVAAAAACSSSSKDAGVAGGGGFGAAGSGAAGGISSGGSWPSGGTGGGALPCDAGFALSPDPPATGSVLAVAYTNAAPLTYVDLKVSGPTTPAVTGTGINTSDPWTWNFEVTGLAAGLYSFEFWAGDPSAKVASCQKNVVDTGPAPDAGSGGSGGGGAGGSGGQCCKLVGTKLANPSPCGPSQADSPWQTLDNAGCDANGCQKIWCPFEKCDSSKYPNGCSQGTEACWIDNSYASYEDACKACCESYGACWDSTISTCRHPGDCGSPLWQCPWQ